MSVLLRCLPVFLAFLVNTSLVAQGRAGSVYLDGGTNFFAQRAEGSLPDAHILRSRALLSSYLEGLVTEADTFSRTVYWQVRM